MLHLCGEGKRATVMSIDISQETEARLAAEARRQGISVDALVARHRRTRGADPTRATRRRPYRSGISAACAIFTGETSIAMSVETGIVDTNVLVYALGAAPPDGSSAVSAGQGTECLSKWLPRSPEEQDNRAHRPGNLGNVGLHKIPYTKFLTLPVRVSRSPLETRAHSDRAASPRPNNRP